MRLCTAADVKARKKSLPNVAAIDATVEDAIDAATHLLEGKLNTFFERDSLTLTYRIDMIENPPTGTMNELFLDRGLLQSSPVPTVKTAFLIEDLDTAEDLVLGKDFHVKEEQGIILLDNMNFLRFGEGLTIAGGGLLSHSHRGLSHFGHTHHEFFARVTYTAGLTDTAGLFDDVPAWLNEAAVVATIIILEQQSKVTKTEFGDQLTPKNQTAWHHLRAILDRRGRFFGAAIKPLF